METLAAQPQIGEQVDRYLRTYNDVTTWLAETLDGAMRTPFTYRFDGHDFIAEDGDRLHGIFTDALADAEQLAQSNPQLGFELRRRQHELAEYNDMLAMARGELPNTMVVVSDFPPELMRASQDVGGYNVSRKQTMLRVLTYADGRLRMYSQSLDGSNRLALEAIYHSLDTEPRRGELLGQRLYLDIAAEDQTVLLDRLMGVYDRSLSQQFGGNWYAGRRGSPRDTYQFVLGQTAVVDRLVDRHLSGDCTASDIYNTAALLRDMFEGNWPPAGPTAPAQALGGFIINLETVLLEAGQRASSQGRTFSGCGGSVSAPGSESAETQLSSAGYGNKAGEDKYGSLKFKCPKGHTNTRPRGKLIPHCQVCGVSVKC